MFQCQYCELATNQLKDLLKHIRYKHESSPYFRVQCVVQACTSTYTSVRVLKRHIIKQHQDLYRENQNDLNIRIQEIPLPQHDDQIQDGNADREEVFDHGQEFQQLQPSDEEGDIVDEYVDNPPAVKHLVAKSLLSLRERYKLPAHITGAIANEIGELVEISQLEIARHVRDILQESDIIVPRDLREELVKEGTVVSACGELDCPRKLEAYVRKELKFVAPEERKIANSPDTLQYIPIQKTLESLLQYDDVFREIQSNHRSNDGVMRDIEDGNYLKNSAPAFGENCLKLMLYIDDFTVTNPLRGKCKSYKIMGTYMMLENLPPKYRSQLHAIQLVSLCKSIHVKTYGLPATMQDIIQDIQYLEENGINVEVQNQNHHFTCKLFVVVGDNLAMHQVGGFLESFVAGKPCRFCMVPLAEMREGAMGPPRTCHSHDEQVAIVEDTPALSAAYGVKSKSVFQGLGEFHAVTSLPSDIAHDILEGVAKSLLTLVVKQCQQDGHLEIPTINACIRQFNYIGTDKVNKPCVLTERGEVKQTFSQMRCLMRLLPLIIGNHIPEEYGPWEALLLLLRVCEYIFAPALRPGHVNVMEDLIKQYYQVRREVFPEEWLRPKDHFTMHYARQTMEFGPLVHLWTVRFEAKHSYFIDVLKSSKNRKNVCLTMAKRHQFMQSLLMEETCLFQSQAEVLKGSVQQVHQLAPRLRVLVQEMTDTDEVHLGKQLKVGSTVYGPSMAVVVGMDGDLVEFAEVRNGLIIHNIPYIVAQRLVTKQYEWHFNAYIVERAPETLILRTDELKEPHPLGIYTVPERNEISIVLQHRPLF